ncbi:MAG: hypothetical protein ABFD79_11505 [Phycisphaerales bacterium]
MNNLFQNIIAVKDDNWVQLLIFVVIFGIAILKKIFSGLKTYVEEQNRQAQEGSKQYTQAAKKTRHVYADDAFKTIEQMRDEKIAQIRAAYGIPEPKKAPEIPLYEEPEPEELKPAGQQIRPEPMLAQPIREQMFSPPVQQEPVYTPPPVYRPKIKKKSQQRQRVESKAAEHTAKPKEQTKPVYEMIIKLSNPEDLRNAILYQEILGKPLALRD